MENAAEALKMAFAVLVFVIALSVTFMMITLIKSTADDVFIAKDKQEYVADITAIRADTAGAYRVVGIDTVIPTIYRYAQENYGVIIVEGNEIVALYDLQVENDVSQWSTTWDHGKTHYQDFEDMINGKDEMNIDGTLYQHIEGIKEYVNKTVDNSNKIPDSFDFRNLFSNIYKIDTNTTSCPWTSSKYNIMRRIKADMSINLSDSTIFFNETGNTMRYYGKHWGGQSFMKKYGGRTFKEYYHPVKKKNAQTQEEEVTKLQVIYVVRP